MILHALKGYYQRMLASPILGCLPTGPASRTSPLPWSLARTARSGRWKICASQTAEICARARCRCRRRDKNHGVKANFIWDKAAYVFGADADGATEKNRERFVAFNDLLQSVVKDTDDGGFAAVKKFLQQWNCEQSEELVVQLQQSWEEVCSANLVFRLDGTPGFIHDRRAIQREWLRYGQENADASLGKCLITGEADTPLARIHTPIKGVRGGQTSGGYMVSFNASAFVSYNQDKASVAETSAFAYTTALNSLLSGDSRQTDRHR